MKKAVKINYPKRKPKVNFEQLGDVSEPERCSMYQLLLENLNFFNRATFLHRIIYVGEHKFPTYDVVKEVFSNIVKTCNETNCIEKISGFLLYYPKYFVHMVEGDEDNLNKHLGYLLDKSAEHYESLGNLKLLIHISNINQRFLEDWQSYTDVPSKLLEKLDIDADLQQSGRNIYNCIKKIYALIGAYAEDITATSTEAIAAAEEKPNLDLSATTSGELTSSKIYSSISYGSNADESQSSAITTQSTGINQRDYKFFLPEYELLEFVIKSKATMLLQEYYDFYGIVPMRDIYKDKVWPVPHDFIPYDVFEKNFDCVTELPKELRKRQHLDVSATPSVAQSITSFINLTMPKANETAYGDTYSNINVSETNISGYEADPNEEEPQEVAAE